jgi:hypothetical protein
MKDEIPFEEKDEGGYYQTIDDYYDDNPEAVKEEKQSSNYFSHFKSEKRANDATLLDDFFTKSLVALFIGLMVWSGTGLIYLSPVGQDLIYDHLTHGTFFYGLMIAAFVGFGICVAVFSVKKQNELAFAFFLGASFAAGYLSALFLIVIEIAYNAISMDTIWVFFTVLSSINLGASGSRVIYAYLKNLTEHAPIVVIGINIFYIVFIGIIAGSVVALISIVGIFFMLMLMELGARDTAYEIAEGYWMAGILAYYFYYFYYFGDFFIRLVLIIFQIIANAN